MGRWYELSEAAERLSVCEATIRRLIADGTLNAIKFRRNIRVSEEALVAFIREHAMEMEK